ncbi:MAG: hypothetical protein NTW21_28740 [Verrucomicrobia bacterium]|nr:hypothetical protein [Verrucomicrobiota bacterium]
MHPSAAAGRGVRGGEIQGRPHAPTGRCLQLGIRSFAHSISRSTDRTAVPPSICSIGGSLVSAALVRVYS